MGWLEGLLTGYMDRSHDIEKDKMAEAVAADAREAEIYKTLLNSPNQDIRTMAATGMMQSGQPRRKAGGLQGWLGEVQANPLYSVLQKYMTTQQTRYEDITKTTTPQQAGYLPKTSPTAQPAAQVNAQTTIPGTPG